MYYKSTISQLGKRVTRMRRHCSQDLNDRAEDISECEERTV